jgi:hypothetical protein
VQRRDIIIMTQTSIFSKTQYRVIAVAVLVALLGAVLVGPLTADAKPPAKAGDGALTTDVTGTFTDALGGTGTFVGTFTAQQFKANGGTLTVLGTVTGTLTDSTGAVLGTATQQVTTPLQATATCEILDLTLGPLDLDLLGLVVHLDQVNLEITAEQGPGNLLGNLLCAVAGLLDGGFSLNLVADLLNAIIGVLEELGLA